jgi:hypothetical protein
VFPCNRLSTCTSLLSIETNIDMAFISKYVIVPLINIAKSSNIYALEMGINNLANLLLNIQIVE